MHWVLAMSPPQGNGQGGGGSMLPMMLMWGLVILIFYFLMIRPQQKKQKDAQKLLEGLKKGDRVLTQSGLFGTVVSIKDNVAVLKVAEQVRVEMLKSSITTIVESAREA